MHDSEEPDVGSLSARPPNVVQHVVSGGTQQFQLGANGLLAGVPPGPWLGLPVDQVGAIQQRLGFLTQPGGAASSAFQLLAR